MNLIENGSTSPRVIVNQQSKRSSQSIRGEQKPKILIIILSDDENTAFEQFCLEIYNQSLYLSHKNLAQIDMCSTYEEYQQIEKDPCIDYYILSSQKIIQQLEDVKEVKQNWVVFDSGIGSRKKILDMSNVVYYTKQLQSLRNKLQSRKFISKPTLLDEKYRRSFELKKKKVENHLTTPIQTYIQASILSTQNNILETQNAPSIIEALKSQFSNKTKSDKNISQEKIKSNLKINDKQKSLAGLVTQKSNNLVRKNTQQTTNGDYLLQSIPEPKSLKIPTNNHKKQMQKDNQNLLIGPGSNRVINLTDYKKFNQNGVIVYRKNTPDKVYLRPASQNQEKLLSNSNPTNSVSKHNDYFMENHSSFNPQNATYDHKNSYNNFQDNKRVKKPYRTCDSEFYNIQSNYHKISSQVDSQKSNKIKQQQFYSESDSKVHKRNSEQMKQHLDEISSYRKEDDYQMKGVPKIRHQNQQKNVNYGKFSNKPPLPVFSESRVRQLIFREKPKSQSKTNSLSSRFVGSDSLNGNKKSNLFNSNSETNQPQNSAQHTGQSSLNSQHKSVPKSLPSRVNRPLLRSAEKRQKKIQALTDQKQSNDKRKILPSQISQKGSGQKSTVESYIVYVPRQINPVPDKKKLSTQNVPSYLERYGLVKRKQDASILYLVDHLMEASVISYLQSFITSNDSIYRFKNLNQLQNQIRQSVEVYDNVFVFKEQIISSSDIQQFYSINPECYFVDIDSKEENNKLHLNKLTITNLSHFGNALTTIVNS